ncbi:hypothetical protein [Solimonas terrae]|uniref:RcnB family protein n=1 Tax=Solimonas terrae TaxID=1396819 RepID=A0A6M2BSJ0_9GAMM|nr:hypothetical protein [Solimonas terrae]NGY05556.1 hypothetical protein [Solimonas terrae]
MRRFRTSTKLVAAGLLAATATLAMPSAFADDHYRDSDRGQIRQQPSHADDHDRDRGRGNDDHRGHDNDRHDYRAHDRHGYTQTQSWHDSRDHGRVVYTRQPVFYRGSSIPVGYRHAIQPMPAAYRYRAQVVPRGYRVGYYQGYSVVYDPGTFLILSVIDLLANN